jgi:hypothetical protein
MIKADETKVKRRWVLALWVRNKLKKEERSWSI